MSSKVQIMRAVTTEQGSGKSTGFSIIRAAGGGEVGVFKCPNCPRAHVVMLPSDILKDSATGRSVATVVLSPEEAEAFASLVLETAGFQEIKINAKPPPAGQVH